MATLEERVGKIEQLLSQVFRPGGTFAIRDDDREAAAMIVGDVSGNVGAVLMSVGLSIKEPTEDTRVVVTPTAVGIKDENDTLRLLISQQGLLFLAADGQPLALITEDGVHRLEPGEGGGK